ncbi:hypothetical protein E3J85_01430 [Patescibacteria group bacterium]|nr:MAG: hypothetical protein E3J85_01430 [Patescibacteria group bacterium]
MPRVKHKQILKKLFTPQTFFLTFFIVLGGFLRFFNITKSGLWYDEAFSAVMVRNPLPEIIEKGVHDVHPPFYYFLLKLWTLILGESELALRGFSALFGMLLIIAVYFLVKNLFNRKVALISSFLITIAPFFIQYSQEVRMYTLGAFLAVMSTFYLWKALHNNQARLNLYYWIGYVVFTILAIYTHYFLIFTVIAQIAGVLLGLIVLPKKERTNLLKKWWHFGLSILFTAVFYLPWLPILLKQSNQVREDFWIPVISLFSVLRTFFVITIGSIETKTFLINTIPLILIVAIVIVLFKKFKQKSTEKSAFILILSYLFVPIIIGILVSLYHSVFLDRYFIFAGVAVFIILGLFVNQIKNSKMLIGGMIIISIIAILLASTNVFGLDAPKKGMRELSAKLEEKHRSNEKIIHSSSFTFIPFKYYNENKEGIIITDEIHHYSGNALIEKNDIIEDLKSYLGETKHLWIIDTVDFGDPPLPKVPSQFKQKEIYQFDNESLIYYERK